MFAEITQHNEFLGSESSKNFLHVSNSRTEMSYRLV